MNHGEWMIVAIVAIVCFSRMYRDKLGIVRPNRRNRRDRYSMIDENSARDNSVRDEAENQRLREEVRALKDRIAVLERIATDSSTHLDREIEALRDRP